MNDRLSRIAAMIMFPVSMITPAIVAMSLSIAADLPAGAAGGPLHQGLPARVHVFEDFETEIERRWWLRSTPLTEKGELAPSLSASVANKRACRAAETRDFDDKQGDPAK